LRARYLAWPPGGHNIVLLGALSEVEEEAADHVDETARSEVVP
jgi:hypothetical protein